MMKIHAEDGLFDIVIRGRGTWAAARSLVQDASLGHYQIELSERSRFFCNVRHVVSVEAGPPMGPEETKLRHVNKLRTT